jgi:hypothetical protein
MPISINMFGVQLSYLGTAIGIYFDKIHHVSGPARRWRGLAVTSRDDVIDGRPPYWRYFLRAVLMEITLENGQK